VNTVYADRKSRKVHIWYNADGLIVAVGHAQERTEEAGHVAPHRQAIPLTLQDQFLLEAEISEELIGEVHSTHRVDIRRRALVAQNKTAE
jgi:hypothetical protein